MTINLSDFFNKEVTVTLRNGETCTGTITSSFGEVSINLNALYPYFMEAPNNEILAWTNTGRWNRIESEYDIVSIVETSPKQQLLKSIQETEQQLDKLKKQLEQQKAQTFQEAKVGDTLEDGSIVLKKENGLALLIAPKSTEVQCQWTRQFSEVFDKLSSEGFISSQWFIPSVEQLKLAYKVIHKELYNGRHYWTSSEYNAHCACYVSLYNGIQHNSNKNLSFCVRAFRCISY